MLQNCNQICFVLQGLHKGVRVSKGSSTEALAELLELGSILEPPIHKSREMQLEDHHNRLDAYEGQNTQRLKQYIRTAQELEEDWKYEDFEATVLRALPMLVSPDS